MGGRLRRRLLSSVAMLVAAVALASAVSLWGLFDVRRQDARVAHAEAGIVAMMRLSIAVRDAYAHQAHMLLLADPSHLEHTRETFGVVDRALLAARAALHDGGGPTLLEIAALIRAFDENFERRLVPILVHGGPGLDVAHDRALTLVEDVQARIDGTTTVLEAAAQAARQAVDNARRRTFWLNAFVFAGALLVALVFGSSVDRTLVQPLVRLAGLTQRIAGGDLDVDPRRADRSGNNDGDELVTLEQRLFDMTHELKARQKRLVESEKLASAGRLAAGVAHEINNPLSVILGYARLLEKKGEADARVIVDEVDRCRSIVRGLLDLARPQDLDLTPTNLLELTAEVAERHEVLGATFDVDGTPVIATVDAGKVRQIVDNLVKNAIEAAPGRPVHIRVARRDVHAVIQVRDEGQGIDPALRGRLFEPFATTRERDGGTGLGLAVSQALAQAHGGALVVADDGDTGHGACFELTLPAGSTHG